MTNTPRTPTPRSDGWTPERQRIFLAELADCGSVTQAAARAKMSKQSVYQLRRHPKAADFRKAWDEALIDSWRRVTESAIERVINGETEVYEKDGVQVIRHRPCAPHLVVHMLDRAERVIAAARARENAEAARVFNAKVEYVRAEIRSLAAQHPEDKAAADAKLATMPKPARHDEDGETIALRRNHALIQSLPDLSAAFAPSAESVQKRKLRQLRSGTAMVPEPGLSRRTCPKPPIPLPAPHHEAAP